MMLFAYQQSPEPVIKNRVLSDAMNKDLGPRNMAQGGRIGYYKGESVVKSHGAKVLKLTEAGESSVSISKKLGLNQQSVNSAMDAMDQGLAGDKFKLSKPRKDIIKKTFNQFNVDVRDPKILNEVLKVIDDNPTLNQKEIIKRGLLSKNRARLVPAKEYGNPGKEWNDLKAKLRNDANTAWTKRYSSISIEDKTRGDSNIHRQHGGSPKEKVGTDNTMFLDAKTNTTDIRPFEKAIDEIQLKQNQTNLNRSMPIEEKRKIFAELKAQEDALRLKYPEYSPYKSTRIFEESAMSPTGYKFKEVMTNPELTISKGETGNIFKYKGKKIKSKDGQKIKELSDEAFEKIKFPDKIKKKIIKIGCGMYAGGRVGLKNGSGACVAKALKKMDNPKGLSAVESRLAKEVVSESKKLAKAGSWIKGDLYFAGAEMFNNWSKGQGFLRGLNNAFELATLGAVDVEADEYALSQLIKKQGSKEDKEAFANYLDVAKKFNKLKSAETSLTNAKETLASDEIIGPDDQMLLESRIKEEPKRVKKLEKIAMDTLEKDDENPTIDKGYRIMNEYIERLAAQDWNKTAGTAADRGYREMVGAKGDEGILYGPAFSSGEFKKYRPQDTMNYHPVYGYKEDLKKEMRRGNSPMVDLLDSMYEYAPDNLLQIEAEADDRMGNTDYRKAEGGIMGIKRK